MKDATFYWTVPGHKVVDLDGEEEKKEKEKEQKKEKEKKEGKDKRDIKNAKKESDEKEVSEDDSNEPSAKIALEDISLKVDHKNKRVMVVGRVGSGKSALAQALISQLHMEKGTLETVGTIAYVPQTVHPFILPYW